MKDIELMVKTYPHDYVFNEAESLYSGIYRRQFYKGKTSQYEYIKKRGVKSFNYHINIEIKNELTPDTWLKKEI